MRSDDLEGFGPVGTNGPEKSLVERLTDYANLFASVHRDDVALVLAEAAAELRRVEACVVVTVKSECHDSGGDYHIDTDTLPEEEAVMALARQRVRLVPITDEGAI